ncbi:MAG TPA: hypothetical protein PKE51_10415 [Gemmatimonadaceae bacterium]|nr:hypothetical protein [Gemmatimonadaceae bacterium]
MILRAMQDTAEAVPPSAIIEEQQDSAATASSVVAPPMSAPAGPPDSSFHMKLGYTLAGVLFAAYIALLLKRVASVRRSR